MIRAGDSIVNPVTGETLVFHRTARDTNGELTQFETFLGPDAFVASAHVHPFQTERFEVLAGTLTVTHGRRRVELGAGDSITIEPGTKHRFRNASDEVVRFVCEVRPALQFEALIETMFGLAADGRTNRKGMPNPLQLAVIANHHFDDVRLPHVPHGAAEGRPRRRRSARPRAGLPRGIRACRGIAGSRVDDPARGGGSRAAPASPLNVGAAGSDPGLTRV